MIGLREKDPDRYLTALFAPEPARGRLALLYGVNHELARASEVASEPMLALIRLHWWREVVEGEVRTHELATPLSAALNEGLLPREGVLALIDARDRQAEGLEPDDVMAFARATGGKLARMAGQCLGVDAPELEDFGTAQALVGLVRNAEHRRAHGLEPRPEDFAPREALLAEAAKLLPCKPPKGGLAAWVGAALVKRDLARLRAGKPCPHKRGAGDVCALFWAGLIERV
jgi:phytoene synthase